MKQLLIVLSTYNGEKYLRQQIDSLLEQENVDFDILIRDDGSKDSTLDIIKSYKDIRIRYIEGNNIGYVKSFLELITYADNYRYCALCDQDDIWKKRKCYTGIKAIEEYQSKLRKENPALLYYSNSRLIDQNNNIIGTLYNQECYQAKGDEILFNCNGSGFTYILNNELVKLINQSGNEVYESHDRWIQYVARYCGNVIYDNRDEFALHRVHLDNTSSNIIGSKKKWRTIINVFSGNHVADQIATKILKLYSTRLTEEDIKTLRLISEYPSSLKSKLTLIFAPEIKRTTFVLTALLKLRILLESV